MSFSGKIAYKMLMVMTKVFPATKTNFTDVDSALEKADTYMYFAEELCAGNARAYKAAYDRAGVGDRLHIHIQPEMMHGYSCMPVFLESKKKSLMSRYAC